MPGARVVTQSGDPTRFPNGVSDAGQADWCGRTSVTGTATIATGLETVEGVIASLEVLSVTAKQGYAVEAKASATPGSIDVTVRDTVLAVATPAVVVNWLAYGAA